MSAMMALQLGQNRLNGTIPSELASLQRLDYLNLASNSLGGPVPSFLGALTTLQSGLMLGYNSLVGTLPFELSALLSLTGFSINNNLCVYGPRVSIGRVGTSYSTAGTALGTWAVPAACNLTLGPAPPSPPPSPPSPPAPPPPPAASAGDRAALLAINSSWCARNGRD